MRSTIGDTANGGTRRGTGLRDPRYVGGDRTREATARNGTDVVLGVLERITPLDGHIVEAERANRPLAPRLATRSTRRVAP